MNNETMVPLPDKLSDLLLLALRDLKACEENSDYEICMEDIWHAPKGDKCLVCLAGAVMANSLRIPANQHVGPYDFGNDIFHKLQALDLIRKGKIATAMWHMGVDWYKLNLYNTWIFITSYEDDPNSFYRDMNKIVNYLQTYGY